MPLMRQMFAHSPWNSPPKSLWMCRKRICSGVECSSMYLSNALAASLLRFRKYTAMCLEKSSWKHIAYELPLMDLH